MITRSSISTRCMHRAKRYSNVCIINMGAQICSKKCAVSELKAQELTICILQQHVQSPRILAHERQRGLDANDSSRFVHYCKTDVQKS